MPRGGIPFFALVVALAAPALSAAAETPRAPAYVPQVINPDLTGGLALPGGAALVYGTDATILRTDDGRRWVHALAPGSADLARIAVNGSILVAVGQKATL